MKREQPGQRVQLPTMVFEITMTLAKQYDPLLREGLHQPVVGNTGVGCRIEPHPGCPAGLCTVRLHRHPGSRVVVCLAGPEHQYGRGDNCRNKTNESVAAVHWVFSGN